MTGDLPRNVVSTATPRPTLREVAQRAGFSLRTTKKVMSQSEPVPDATRDAILAAAAELGYVKNSLASALANARQERIGLVYGAVTAAYFPEVERGFTRFANEFRDYGLTVEFATLDKTVEDQRATLEAMLADESITGVVLQPLSASRLAPVIQALSDAGKPVITFGSDAPDTARLAYVGPDGYKAGRIGAQILANYIGRQGLVLVVSRSPEHIQTRDRRRGFFDVLGESFPQAVGSDLVIDNTDETYETIKRQVLEHDPRGIFITYADSAIGGRVLRDLGRGDIVLIGFDMSEETATLMKQGWIQLILEQNPEVFSYQALKMMFDLRYGGKVPKRIVTTEISVLTSEFLT